MTPRRHLLALLVIVFAAAPPACSSPQTTPDEPPKETPPEFDKRKIRWALSGTEAQAGLGVEVAFRGDDSGETTVVLPRTLVEAEEGLSSLEVLTDDAKLLQGAKPHLKRITHPPGAVVTLQYRIAAHAPPTDSAGRADITRPFIQPESAFFTGGSLLAQPKRMHPGRERPIAFDWSALPDGWEVRTSFGSAEETAELKTALGAVLKSVFVLGNFEARRLSIDEMPFDVVTLGDRELPVDAVAEEIGRIARAQHDFWKGADMPRYLAAVYTVSTCCWTLGVNRYHAFLSMVAADKPASEHETLLRLFASQYLQNWIPRQLGPPDDFDAFRWLYAGVNRLYARRFLLQTGIVDFEDHVRRINQTLEKYWTSDERNSTDRTDIPFLRGQLLALNWDAAIREATDGEHTFDDVLRELAKRHDRDDETKLSEAALAEVVGTFAPSLDTTAQIEAHLDKGETIEMRPDALGPCVTYSPPKTDGGEPKPPSFEITEQNPSSTCSRWIR